MSNSIHWADRVVVPLQTSRRYFGRFTETPSDEQIGRHSSQLNEAINYVSIACMKTFVAL